MTDLNFFHLPISLYAIVSRSSCTKMDIYSSFRAPHGLELEDTQPKVSTTLASHIFRSKKKSQLLINESSNFKSNQVPPDQIILVVSLMSYRVSFLFWDELRSSL